MKKVVPHYTEAEEVRSEFLTSTFHFRLTTKEAKEAKEAAKSENIPLSLFIRLAMRDRKLTVQARKKR